MTESIKENIKPSHQKKVTVDICSIVPGYIEEFKMTAKKKQIYLFLDYPENVQYFVDLEINGFEKSLKNIMDNAFRFAKSKITVRVYVKEKTTSDIFIEFFDDGEAIPEEYEKNIFERGWTSRGASGHGLGLAFVKEYLQKMDGSITLENKKDRKGKSFIIQIPLSQDEARSHSGEDLPELLIAEDDNELRQYLKDMLSSDFSIVSVSSYIETLSRLKSHHPPDIILLDRMLGKYDGIEILKQLKNTLRIPSLPLVFLSGLSESEKRMEALNLGAADYITKPFQIEELRIRLLSIIKRDAIVIQAFKDKINQLDHIPRLGFFDQLLPEFDLRMYFYKKHNLSKREIEIAEMIILIGDITEKGMAKELQIALPTIKNHKSNIFLKLDVKRREDILDKLINETKNLHKD